MSEQQRLEHLVFALPPDEGCPGADELAAYILGQLDGNEHLRLAAHVRGCSLCRYQAETCRPPQPRSNPVQARLVPLGFAHGQRSQAIDSNVRQYVAAHLLVELVIVPPDGEHWRITGQVLRDHAGVADCLVTARTGRRRFQHSTDAQGFFTFDLLPEGRYTLSVNDGLVAVQIRGIVLTIDDE